MKIFLDMDGVLVGFEKGFKDNFGISADDAHKQGTMWSLVYSGDPISFWINLPPMPDYMKLWNHVKSKAVTILTGCPHGRDMNGRKFDSVCPFAKYGKFYWGIDKIGPSFLAKNVTFQPVFSEDKWRYAKPGYILIDDREDLCKDWESKTPGAIAICHKNADDTIEKLMDLTWSEFISSGGTSYVEKQI